MTLSRLHDVFLSYSRKDTEMMHRVRNALIAEGIIVWTDEGIKVGTPSWEKAIESGIENAGALVVILSPDAKHSEWVGREIAYTRTQGKQIFPILVSEEENTAIPIVLINYQYVDIRYSFDNFKHQLISSLSEYFGTESISEVRARLSQREQELNKLSEELEIEKARIDYNFMVRNEYGAIIATLMETLNEAIKQRDAAINELAKCAQKSRDGEAQITSKKSG